MFNPNSTSPHDPYETDSFIIRATELDDCDSFISHLEQKPNYKSQESSLNLIYNYPNLVSLVEKSYLSITILDTNAKIVGIAIFNDFPQGLRGMIDFQHENFWENWLFDAFHLENQKRFKVTSYNSLWMIYYGVERDLFPANPNEYEHLMSKVFQHVYGSLPNIECLLFLYRGEAVDNETTKEVNYKL